MTDVATLEMTAAHKLRRLLKEQGLEHTIRLMSVIERGEARRLIREALYSHTLKLAEKLPPVTDRKPEVILQLLVEDAVEPDSAVVLQHIGFNSSHWEAGVARGAPALLSGEKWTLHRVGRIVEIFKP